MLAAVVATHPPDVVMREGLSDYWTHSRRRIDRWHQVLGTGNDIFPSTSTTETQRAWAASRPILEEVIASDILTRVWSAVLAGSAGGPHSEASIGRSIFLAHQEIRGQIFAQMADAPAACNPEVCTLNLIRHSCERWTDLLLARLSRRFRAATTYCCSSRRLFENIHALGQPRDRTPTDAGWAMLLAAFRANVAAAFCSQAASPDLNGKIAAAILGSVDPAQFDSVGLLRSAWQVRLDATSKEATHLLTAYFADQR